MNLLIYCAIILACIAVWYLTRIFELASELRGEKQYEIRQKDNRLNSRLMLAFMPSFFAFCIWQYVKYKDKLLPVAASEVGAKLDTLLNFNFVIIIVVFFLTNAALFYFAWKYAFSPDRKATFYPDNHKLELAWTVIPGIALAFIIFFGLKTWNEITRELDPEAKDYMVIELYPKQFDWTARYSGADNKLGESNYKLVGDNNPLGIDSTSEAGWDDFIVRDTIRLIKGMRVKFEFRSRDVIHSAYFPHFRQQMNCVPGMRTMLHFIPTITTDSMRMITHNPDFNYILLCNKICGASHYNMQLPIVVMDKARYDAWYKDAHTKVIFASKAPKEEKEKDEPKMAPTGADTMKTAPEKKDSVK